MKTSIQILRGVSNGLKIALIQRLIIPNTIETHTGTLTRARIRALVRKMIPFKEVLNMKPLQTTMRVRSWVLLGVQRLLRTSLVCVILTDLLVNSIAKVITQLKVV